jgi:hemerythrin
MAFINWNTTLSVGIAAMDAQHQRLIELINHLADAMMQGKGQAVIGDTLRNLVDYTRTHFGDEEKLMQTNDYLESSTHRIEHDKLTKQVLDFQDQFQAGKIAVSIELMSFLKNWLMGHIQTHDKRYGTFLNQKGIR